MGPPGGDDLPFAYSGTLLTAGQGLARVAATGVQTEIGKIGKALQTVVPEPSSIQRETRRAVLDLRRRRHRTLHSRYRSSTLSRAATGWTDCWPGSRWRWRFCPKSSRSCSPCSSRSAPGAFRRQGVLTRRVPAIETLGSATVLCVDKTGTLTQNRMAVRRLWVPGKAVDLAGVALPSYPRHWSSLRYWRASANRSIRWKRRITNCSATASRPRPRNLAPGSPCTATRFRRSSCRSPTSGSGDDGDARRGRCQGSSGSDRASCARLDAAERAAIESQVAAMAADGLRVLGVAKGTLPATRDNRSWPASQRELELQFLGLTGLADPVRPAVPAAVRECYEAGIRVVMITGDYAGTAQTIARQIGIAKPENVITGHELDTMSDRQLRERAAAINIFARVVPEQKLRLVQALKANGEIVAMTGDGVNDAPALKAAHIGMAMGGRGTGRGPRSRLAGAARRRLHLDRGRRSGSDGASSTTSSKAMTLHRRGARADRRHGAAAAAVRLAAGVLAGAHRVPGIRHRPGVLDRLRGRACGAGRDAAAAASGVFTPV